MGEAGPQDGEWQEELSERASWRQQPSEARGPESLYRRRQEVSGASVSLLSQARAQRPRGGVGGGRVAEAEIEA